MNKAYSRIAWGLALDLIDFRLQNFDLFPDVLGYFLIMLGLSQLSRHHRYYSIAWAAAGFLLLMAIVQFFGFQAVISSTDSDTPSVMLLMTTSILLAAEMLMMFGICGGIQADALVRERLELADSASNGWRVFFALGTLLLIILPFQLNFGQGDLMILTIMLGLGVFINSIWILLIVRRAGRELNGGGSEGGNGPDRSLGQNIDLIG